MTFADNKKSWKILKYEEVPFRANLLLDSSSEVRFSPDIIWSIFLLSAMVVM